MQADAQPQQSGDHGYDDPAETEQGLKKTGVLRALHRSISEEEGGCMLTKSGSTALPRLGACNIQ